MSTGTIRNTEELYEDVIRQCEEIFIKKTKDYGTAWRVLRNISIIDQIYIKAQRIRTIQQTGKQKIGDNIQSEFIGIINYAVIGNIQLHLPGEAPDEMNSDEAAALFRKHAADAKALMMDKNHDYGEAWREMSQESFADLILMKLQRMKQILLNKGQTLISEGLDANYSDIINYGVFALILINEKEHNL